MKLKSLFYPAVLTLAVVLALSACHSAAAEGGSGVPGGSQAGTADVSAPDASLPDTPQPDAPAPDTSVGSMQKPELLMDGPPSNAQPWPSPVTAGPSPYTNIYTDASAEMEQAVYSPEPEALWVVITNHGEDSLQFGEPKLELEQDGTWYQLEVPADRNFYFYVLHGAFPGTTVLNALYVWRYCDAMIPGHYRAVIEIDENTCIPAEFDVEQSDVTAYISVSHEK